MMRPLTEDDFATLPPVLQFPGGPVSIGGMRREPSGKTTYQCECCMSIVRSEPLPKDVAEARRMLEFWKGQAAKYLRDSIESRDQGDRDAATVAFVTCAQNVAIYAERAGVKNG